MEWTAWNNGDHHKTGGGYGLQIPVEYRDSHFDLKFGTVILEIETQNKLLEIRFNIDKDSFWGPNCNELIKKEFGIWLLNQELAPWPKGHPPKLLISKVGIGRFHLDEILSAY